MFYMRDTIAMILKEQFEWEDSLIKRDVELCPVLNKAISVVGVRRCGKTCLLRYYFQEFKEQEKNVVFFPFDDDRIFPPTLKHAQEVVKVAKELYPEGKIYFFFDEIQEITNWELLVKRLVEREKHYVFISGSSSKLLSKEIATQLRGRTLSVELFPFNLREILRAKNVKVAKYLTEREIAKIRRILKKYLYTGGFPEVIIEDKEKVLKEYINTIIFRDLLERWKIRNYKALKLFLKLAFSSFSSKFSINNVVRFMKSNGIDVSRNTLYNYLEYATDAYLLFPLKKFSFSQKEIEQSLPKMYCIDNGLIKTFSLFTTENLGRLMENVVFLNLRSEYKENEEIFYFETKEGYEVDFLIREGLRIKQLIQVTYANDFDEVDKREIRALLHARELFKKHGPELLCITWDYEDEREVSWWGKRGRIKFIPLWKWLLNL